MEMIAVDLLQEGVVLAEDVYDKSDALLLTADTVLNARHLSLLRSRGVKTVAIREGPPGGEPFRSQAAVDFPPAVPAVPAPPALDAAAQARVERLKGMFVDHIRNPWMHALFIAAVRRAAGGPPRA